MNDLPEGWAATCVAAITKPVFKNDLKNDPDKEIWYIDISSIDSQAQAIESPQRLMLSEAPARARQIVQTGDVLFSLVRPYLRKIARVTQEFYGEVASTGFAVLRSATGIDPKFLFFKAISHDFVAALTEDQYGVSYPAVKEDQVKSRAVELPPFNEQRRIVEKIENLFAELDKGEESLRAAKAQAARYRQSLLKYAFEGHLTADWRAANPNKLENPNTLLTRIRAKRDARYKQALADWKEATKKWPGDGEQGEKHDKPRKPADIVEFEHQILPAIPACWMWVSLDELVSGKPRAMQSGPFGSNLKHSEFVSEGVLVLGIDNVREGFFSKGNQNRISSQKYAELKKYTARPGDLLITVMASLGRSCVVPDDLEAAIISKHIYRISMERELLNPEFYNLLLQADWVTRKSMFNNAQGQTRPGLNSAILRALPVPLLTVTEQAVIVGLLEAKLSTLDALEDDLDSQLALSKALRQSILKRAFSGKLVPQDPADEPASKLLERITAENAEAAKKAKAAVQKKRERKPKPRRIIMADLIAALKDEKDWVSAEVAARRLGIADGATSDAVEDFYRDLRELLENGKVAVERRGDADWLRLTSQTVA